MNGKIKHQIYSNSNKSVIVHVCFVLFSVCLYTCVCECLLQNSIANQNIKIILLQNNIDMSEVHCGSAIRFGQAFPGYLITAHHLYACLM